MIYYEAHFPETGRKKIFNTLGYKSDRYEVKSQRIGENNSCWKKNEWLKYFNVPFSYS
jgi:hypothetical protein